MRRGKTVPGQIRYAIDFWLTTYCQARCRSCARTNPEDGTEAQWLDKEHMSLDTFVNRLSGFDEYLEYIQFCGEMGDPCMHPKVNDFITRSFDYTDEVHVLTNGGLRQPDWYAELAEKYTDFRGKHTGVYFKFGIDGTDQETNEMYREGVNFQRAYDNMKAYFNAGGNGTWHYLIFEWNWHDIPNAIEMAKDLGTDINFKFNGRGHGLITPENKKMAVKLLKDYNYQGGAV